MKNSCISYKKTTRFGFFSKCVGECYGVIVGCSDKEVGSGNENCRVGEHCDACRGNDKGWEANDNGGVS